jgi:hypothetical protein
MTAPLTVAMAGERPVVEQHRAVQFSVAVLSSVPDRFRPTVHAGDVTLVDASVAGWAKKLEAAARQGARGILVAAAGTMDGSDEVRAAAAAAGDAGVVVVADRGQSADRAWRDVAPSWRADAATSALLDSTASTTDNRLDHVLLEQLALLRAIVGRPHHLRTATLSASAYQITGTAGTVRISLSAAPGPNPALAVDLIGVQRRRRAQFDGLGLATPARISEFDQAGARTEPVRYESPHRVAWLELHAALTDTGVGSPRPDLDDLAEDIAWARHLLDADRPVDRQHGRQLRQRAG